MVATIPQGHGGTPQDCVGASLFLLSALLSGYITGHEVNGNRGQRGPSRPGCRVWVDLL